MCYFCRESKNPLQLISFIKSAWKSLKASEHFSVWMVMGAFALLQCVGITDPPLEMAHSWRQAFTSMVTRNYVELGMDWLHPRIDMAGEKTGIVGAEFPIFNFLAVLLARVFGYAHWQGRVVNLVVVIWGAYHFYCLLKYRFTERTALFSVSILLCSSWFTFSRKAMPDTFSVSLVLVGLRYGFDYWFFGRWRSFIWAMLAISLGVLSKIPAMSLLAIVAVLPFFHIEHKGRAVAVCLGLTMAVLPSLWWYFYWVPVLNQQYGYHLFFPKGLVEGWHEIVPLWRLLLEKFYFTSFYSFLALFFAFVGMIALKKRAMRLESLALAMVTVVFGLFILKTGAVFPQHTYYSVPFVPVMALLSGLGIDFLTSGSHGLKDRWYQKPWVGFSMLILLSAEAISNQFHDHFIKPSEEYKLTLESELAAVIPMDAKVVFASSASPQELYLLHRKGWTLYMEQLLEDRAIENYQKLGAQYVIINLPVLENASQKSSVEQALGAYPLFYQSAYYKVYRLR